MNRLSNYCRFVGLSALAVIILSGMVSCRYLSIPEKDDILVRPVQQTEKNDVPAYNSAIIKGRIISTDKVNASTLIITYRPADGNKAFGEYAVVNGQGAFMLYLSQGRYNIYTITDYNHNGIYENDEISGAYGSPSAAGEISIHENELITGVVIRTARDNGRKMTLPDDLMFKKDQGIIKQVTHNGQVLKIYHEYFSPENAQTGYWNPSSFMKAFGAHIYLTEEYSPRKIPILFVHGAEGSPQNWIYFYMRLDRSRYQPWFFYYPSGIRLPLAAALLNDELQELHKKYGFSKMAIVAHSVGGLTTRAFLTRYASDKQNNFIKLFVSFATPWGGFGAADLSQIITHKSIPIWVDLGTQSAFIKTTMAEKLSPTIDHYIFYGKNDKLSREKALDARAVDSAIKTFGFDCTHDTILGDRKAYSRFIEILDKELW